MTHKMHLNSKDFSQMEDGIKTVEIRLYDEKRKNIALGNIVEFQNLENGEQLATVVYDLTIEKNFVDLFKKVDPVLGGWEKGTTAEKASEDVLKYYSKEKVEKNGVVAIHVKLI